MHLPFRFLGKRFTSENADASNNIAETDQALRIYEKSVFRVRCGAPNEPSEERKLKTSDRMRRIRTGTLAHRHYAAADVAAVGTRTS